MDPHDIPDSDIRVGKLPEEVYDWMKLESNDNKDKISNPNN
jgi:NAD(P)H-quinone oxidoreductase subunit I